MERTLARVPPRFVIRFFYGTGCSSAFGVQKWFRVQKLVPIQEKTGSLGFLVPGSLLSSVIRPIMADRPLRTESLRCPSQGSVVQYTNYPSQAQIPALTQN